MWESGSRRGFARVGVGQDGGKGGWIVSGEGGGRVGNVRACVRSCLCVLVSLCLCVVVFSLGVNILETRNNVEVEIEVAFACFSAEFFDFFFYGNVSAAPFCPAGDCAVENSFRDPDPFRP